MSQPELKSKGLIWDLENSAYIVDVWQLWQANAIHVREYPQILTIAWQWVGSNSVFVKGQDDFPDYVPGKLNDHSLVAYFRDILSACDYAVAHNGDGHDVPVFNARRALNGLTAPTPYIQVDTKKIYKRFGKFGSNSLDSLSTQFDKSRKGDPGGYETWLGCREGNPKAWKKMKHYNKQDIPPLLDLFLQSKSWDKHGLPLNVMEDRPDGCPVCLSDRVEANNKYKSTRSNIYRYFTCLDCGKTDIRSRSPEKREKPRYV